MPRLTIEFDDEQRLAAWASAALNRHLLPSDAAIVETDTVERAFALTRSRDIGDRRELPIARPDPFADTDALDQRKAIIWLVHALLTEDDSRQALVASNLDPDSIELQGTDITVQSAQGRRFTVQVLPIADGNV